MQIMLFNDQLRRGMVDTAAAQSGIPVVLRQDGLQDFERQPAESADAVVCLDVLQNISDLQGFFEVASRILKPQGRCAMLDEYSWTHLIACTMDQLARWA